VPFLRNRPRPRRRSVVLLALATVLGLVGGGVALADAGQPAIQTTTPHSENQITNIDVLRQQIANYYGDPLRSGVFAADSSYAKEAKGVAGQGAAYLTAHASSRTAAKKAIVLDVDDTTLATWNYEIASNWAYDGTKNAEFVLGKRFPAVPGMVDTVTLAQKEGYAFFFLTWRPTSQEDATEGNLADVGYPAATDPTGSATDDEDGTYTKPDPALYPDYLRTACAADPGGKCTTIHYKAATRAHIEAQGYDIVGNFGDQYSDLTGGSADKTFKLPNPNYYLP
jgi:hypothetical protein